MYCPACGKQIPDESVACNFCGKAVQGSRRNVSGSIIGVILVLGVFGAMAWSLWWRANQPPERNDPATQAAKAPQPVWEEKTVSVLDERFSVGAGNVASWKFTITDDAKDAKIVGRFDAAGGSGNEIDFAILGQDELPNWTNGQQAKGYYFRKAVTDSFNVGPLPPGRYAIAFSNRMSLLSTKQVRVEVSVHYRTLVYR